MSPRASLFLALFVPTRTTQANHLPSNLHLLVVLLVKMQPGLSTHVFLQQRLHPGLLDAMLRGLAPYAGRSGASPVIEVFAARHHFDYTDRSIVRDIALWFRDAAIRPT